MNFTPPLRIFVGWDIREQAAFDVCCDSIFRHASVPVSVEAIGMGVEKFRGVYWRPTEMRRGPAGREQLWDVISNAPMSTGFSFARFLVPHLAGFHGWAVFCDCDFMFRADVAKLFALADPKYAVQVVKHDYVTGLDVVKMDGQVNPSYPRKNWSSLVLWNCQHPSNAVVTPELVNAQTGRDLHGFSWLPDHLIGGLPFEWNWLELEPLAVHFTRGTPDMPGHDGAAYADEYRRYLKGDDHAVEPEGRAAPHQESDVGQGKGSVVQGRE